MSFPMASMLPAGDDVTGSLATTPFAPLLDEEDRRREKAAMSTALDPQGDGTPVRWENPKTGHKGSFAAMGQAYSLDSKVCRGFHAALKTDDTSRSTSGVACAVAAGEWLVHDMKPAKV